MHTALEPAVRAAPPEHAAGIGPFPILPVTRAPDSNLLYYYALCCLLLGPAFIFVLIPAYFRYHTMRYEVDQEGITMRWGLLFRREISLTYARIQDIHLSSNLVERWLGLAKVQIQTASGSAKAEMTIEGLPDAAAIRDFLYVRMRGARDPAVIQHGHPARAVTGEDPGGELSIVLREIAAEVKAIRVAVTRGDRPNADV
jgi:putative membrane protein